MSTHTIEHTIPTGEVVTFTVEIGEQSGKPCAWIRYAADLSTFAASDAYPLDAIAAIAAHECGHAVLGDCFHYGDCDGQTEEGWWMLAA